MSGPLASCRGGDFRAHPGNQGPCGPIPRPWRPNAKGKQPRCLVDINRQLLEALVASGTALANGAQAFSQSLVSLTLSSFEAQLAAGKALASVKTFEEAVDLSSHFAQAGLAKAAVETAHFNALSGKIAEEAMAPLSDGVEAIFLRFTKAA